MSRSTEALIAELAQGLAPVKRLKPPMARAAGWLVGVALLAAVAVALLANLDIFLRRASDPRQMVELFATLLTGVTAVVAAFHLSLPDRPRAWALLPLPFLALWLATAGFGCWREWVVNGPDGRTLGQSADCFAVLVGSSLPMAALLIWRLGKARPLDPGLVTLVGGLGIAALGGLVLQFFHPFEVTLMDLLAHLIGVAVVIAACALVGPRTMRTR